MPSTPGLIQRLLAFLRRDPADDPSHDFPEGQRSIWQRYRPDAPDPIINEGE